MAAPITHIVLTEKVYDNYFSDKQKADFYIGTSFPDIRYLDEIDRSKVHFRGVKLAEIKSETSFVAGLKFHSLIDDIRENFIRSRHLYSLLPDVEYKTQAIKSVEDKVLYGKLENWKEISNYLDEVCEEEIALGASLPGVRRWHRYLKNYFFQGPKPEVVVSSFTNLGWPKEIVGDLLGLIKSLEKNSEVIKIIEGFYEEFETLLGKRERA